MANKGLIAYKLETFYWNDLTISGWFWYIFKPLLMFGSYFLMIQGVFQDIDDINTLLTMTFGWTIYWYCTINIVTNARRMRRYIKLTSFSIKDAVVYHFCDFILSLFFLNILYILLSFFIDVSYTDHLFYPLLLYVITMPIFVKIGTLSINAIDFVNAPQFVPIILLLFLKINILISDSSSIFSIFYFIEVIFFYDIDFLGKLEILKIHTIILIALSVYFYKSVDKEIKYAYKDSIV